MAKDLSTDADSDRVAFLSVTLFTEPALLDTGEDFDAQFWLPSESDQYRIVFLIKIKDQAGTEDTIDLSTANSYKLLLTSPNRKHTEITLTDRSHASGLVEYLVTPQDFEVAGTYTGTIEIAYDDCRLYSRPIKINVRKLPQNQ